MLLFFVLWVPVLLSVPPSALAGRGVVFPCRAVPVFFPLGGVLCLLPLLFPLFLLLLLLRLLSFPRSLSSLGVLLALLASLGLSLSLSVLALVVRVVALLVGVRLLVRFLSRWVVLLLWLVAPLVFLLPRCPCLLRGCVLLVRRVPLFPWLLVARGLLLASSAAWWCRLLPKLSPSAFSALLGGLGRGGLLSASFPARGFRVFPLGGVLCLFPSSLAASGFSLALSVVSVALCLSLLRLALSLCLTAVSPFGVVLWLGGLVCLPSSVVTSSTLVPRGSGWVGGRASLLLAPSSLALGLCSLPPLSAPFAAGANALCVPLRWGALLSSSASSWAHLCASSWLPSWLPASPLFIRGVKRTHYTET